MIRRAIIFATIFFAITGAAFCESEDFEIRIFKVNHGNLESLKTTVEGIVSTNGKVTAHANSNSLIVLDLPEHLERIADVIEKLDVSQKEVMIEVRVTEATKSFLEASGIGPGRVVVGRDEFDIILSLINIDSDTKIQSRMTVRALNNKPAKIQMSTEEVFASQIIRYEDGREITSFDRKPVGDFLEVTPRINADGTIMMNVRPVLSSPQEEGGVYERSLITEVAVNNGDTIILGGIDTGEERRGGSNIGGLTSRRGEALSKKMVMFLTVTVID